MCVHRDERQRALSVERIAVPGHAESEQRAHLCKGLQVQRQRAWRPTAAVRGRTRRVLNRTRVKLAAAVGIFHRELWWAGWQRPVRSHGPSSSSWASSVRSRFSESTYSTATGPAPQGGALPLQ